MSYSFKIGFSKSKKKFAILGKIIQFLQKSNFSHTYIVFKHPFIDNETIFHATSKGLNYMSRPRFEEHNESVEEFTLVVNESQFKEILQTCHDLSGVQYAYLQNLFLAFYKYFKIKIYSNFIFKGQNCSELVANLLKIADLEKFETIKKEPNYIWPVDVYNVLKGQ